MRTRTCGLVLAAIILAAGCDEMGTPHEKPSDEPYAHDGGDDPSQPEPAASSRIDAKAPQCLEITEGTEAHGTRRVHWWRNVCDFDVIVFYCQESITGPTNNGSAIDIPWWSEPDCGGPGRHHSDGQVWYGPEQRFYNRAQWLRVGQSSPISVGETYIQGKVEVDWRVTYRYAVCRAKEYARYKGIVPEFTSEPDGSYDCWINPSATGGAPSSRANRRRSS